MKATLGTKATLRTDFTAIRPDPASQAMSACFKEIPVTDKLVGTIPSEPDSKASPP